MGTRMQLSLLVVLVSSIVSSEVTRPWSWFLWLILSLTHAHIHMHITTTATGMLRLWTTYILVTWETPAPQPSFTYLQDHNHTGILMHCCKGSNKNWFNGHNFCHADCCRAHKVTVFAWIDAAAFTLPLNYVQHLFEGSTYSEPWQHGLILWEPRTYA